MRAASRRLVLEAPLPSGEGLGWGVGSAVMSGSFMLRPAFIHAFKTPSHEVCVRQSIKTGACLLRCHWHSSIATSFAPHPNPSPAGRGAQKHSRAALVLGFIRAQLLDALEIPRFDAGDVFAV